MQYCDNKNSFEQGQLCVPESDLPRLVVVGGGFGGLHLIKEIKNLSCQVVLIDMNNFHQFIPLLYQVATSGLEPENVVFPFRKLFNKHKNFIFRMTKATSIDPAGNTLYTTIGKIKYDYLVLATGTDTNFFGNESFKNLGSGLNSVTDALHIRNKILQNLEHAANTCIEDEKIACSNIVIVGGGATGVEIAGALGEFKRYILPKDYPELNNIEMKIYLIEATGKLLPAMPDKLSQKTISYLKGLEVNVLLNMMVSEYDGEKVVLKNNKTLPTRNFIWTAGVKGNPFEGLPEDSYNKQGRIIVNEYNRIQSYSNIFAIGDIAFHETKKYPKGHPMVAQTAIQQGKLLAANIKKIIRKENMVPFNYKDKGAMTTIGRKKAVAQIGRLKFSGFIAWLIWSVIHLRSIVGVRNKLLVLVNWLWSYFTYDKGDRIIIKGYKKAIKSSDKTPDLK